MSDLYDDYDDRTFYAVWATRTNSRYGLADAAAWVKEGKEVVTFTTREAADAYADELNRKAPASCCYTVREYY